MLLHRNYSSSQIHQFFEHSDKENPKHVSNPEEVPFVFVGTSDTG